jgi:hypothetical protein
VRGARGRAEPRAAPAALAPVGVIRQAWPWPYGRRMGSLGRRSVCQLCSANYTKRRLNDTAPGGCGRAPQVGCFAEQSSHIRPMRTCAQADARGGAGRAAGGRARQVTAG